MFGLESPPERGGFHEEATTTLWHGPEGYIILKRYLVDKVPISDLCDEYGIKPNQIYAWQKILLDHAESAFQQAGSRGVSKAPVYEEKIARLAAKLQQKNEVISELMEENVRAKKPLGNSDWTLGSPRHPR